MSERETKSPEHALLVEDDPAFELSLSQALHELNPACRIDCTRTGEDALRLIDRARKSPDLALVDIGLPDVSGIEVISRLRERFAELPILVISVISAERSVLAAIRAGARGYLLKDDPPQLIRESIDQAVQGNYPVSPSLARYLFKLAGEPSPPGDFARLTPKERELLKHLANGSSYADAAEKMAVAVSTVQTHIRSLYRKLDVHSQVQAINKAQEHGLL